MQGKYLTILFIVISFVFTSCGKKHVPQQTATVAATANKPVVKKKINVPIFKVIAVNDKAAKRNIDGRLYYDLEGRRYWKNYNDGKYYLFNKSMYTDPAFKPH